ncbi:MAG: hypothetical protein A2351_01365 [Omnitrophica bacterium RIFOXYB12_FULL_50_7]|nr:MAG: hypothetical protein A2351_01365 [Omnitrophica bacterium RIFOXYB12_FULL_50_7]
MIEDRILQYRREILVCVILAIMAILVFGQMSHHKFINFDDETYVTDNGRVRQGLTPKNIAWAFTTHHANFWHPLTWLSHMTDCQFFGMKAGTHHMTALVFHIASTFLLFLLFRWATGTLWQAAAIAALFAIHPLHVESVAWVAERKDILSTFFWMLTMLAYVGYVKRRTVQRYLLVLVFFVLGLMAKPMLVTLPFVLLLFDYWPLKRLQLEPTRRLILEKIPFFLIAIAAGVVAYIAQKSGGALGSLEKYPFDVRIANAIVSYADYIGKTLWPAGLAIPYPHPGKIPFLHVAAALAVLTGISVFVFRRVSKYPYLAVGWLWFVGTLLPVIGLVQVGYHAMADRYTYISIIGLFIIIVWGVADLSEKWNVKNKKTVLAVAAGSLFIILLAVAWVQTGYWKNSETLFTHSLSLNPKNLAAHNNLGTALLERKDIKGGKAHFLAALKLDPKNPITHHNLALSLSRQGKEKEAMALYLKALKFNPRQIQTHQKLADALLAQGDLAGAVKHYQEVLKVQPYDTEVRNNIGNALMRQGKVAEAIRHYSEALRLKPDYSVQYNLGSALLESGKVDDAITHLAESLMLKPDNALAHNNLANALARKGERDEALIHYQEALRIKPDLVDAHCNMGIVLKQQGKNKEAIEQFSEALRLDPKSEKSRQNLKLLQK